MRFQGFGKIRAMKKTDNLTIIYIFAYSFIFDKMKRLLFFSILIMTSCLASAQTQQGYVKTKGRMDANGNLVPGQGLRGATVSLQGRTAVLVNAEDGKFSFPVTGAQFRLDSVKKQGYQMVDLEACARTYKYSGNPLYLVMEQPDQQLQDKLTAERKIRRNLQKQLQDKEDEIESLKATQKITEEEYRQALQKLYQDQENNEKLIKDMAKRYSELDYDQLDAFYRQVSFFIENGDLVLADSLLETRGDISAQVADIKQRGKSIQEEKELLQKAEAVQQAEIEEASQRCYSYYETFKAQHLNDTAAYYLKLRSSLDTTNAAWLDETAWFVTEYLADYDNALEYLNKALEIRLSSSGETHPDVALSYNNISSVYRNLGDFENAMEYGNKALEIRLSVFGRNHHDVALSYNNIGTLYADLGDYGKASEYFNKALEIWLSVLGDNNLEIATCYNNIGMVYSKQDDSEKALECYNKALEMRLSIFGENHPDVALIYNNIGFVNWKQGNYEKALEYYNKALGIRLSVLGENHPDVAISYNNIGTVYGKQGDYEMALKYHIKALEISLSILGDSHRDVATNYNNIGVLYYRQGTYEKALEFLNKSLQIKLSVFGETHPEVASCYNNIGATYFKLGENEKALKCFNNALETYLSLFGENHPVTLKVKEKISEVETEMKK